MDDPISFRDGQVGSAPIVISRDLYARIERIAAQADMEAVDLIQLLLKNVFDDPDMTPEALGDLIRHMPEEP